MIGGAPLYVPPGLRPDQLEPYRGALQREMDRINELADQWTLHGTDVLPPLTQTAARTEHRAA
jgi:hypothetical protein